MCVLSIILGLFTTPYTLRIANHECIDAYNDPTTTEYKTFIDELTEIVHTLISKFTLDFFRIKNLEAKSQCHLLFSNSFIKKLPNGM